MTATITCPRCGGSGRRPHRHPCERCNRTGRVAQLHCHGCGAEIDSTYAKSKWCSSRCRKRTLYGTPCVDCGARTCGDEGLAPTERCAACAPAAAGQRSAERALAIRQRVQQLWCEGRTGPEIAELLGWSNKRSMGTFIAKMRREGWDLPYRRPDNLTRDIGAQLARARARLAQMHSAKAA